MKNKKVCPKCGCNKILLVPGSARAYGAGNNIFVGYTVLSAVLVERYVCSECGYSEEWIDKEGIEALKTKYNYHY